MSILIAVSFGKFSLESVLFAFIDVCGISSLETSRTIVVAVYEFAEVFERQITEAVRADDLCNLLNRMVYGDKVFSRIDIRTVIARIEEGRSGYTHVYFFCARLSQKRNDMFARRTSYDRVVYEYHSLSRYRLFDRIEFDIYEIDSLVLLGRDKRPADIFVFDKAYAVRYSRSLRITERCVESRIGYAYYYVGVYGMSLGEKFSRLFSRPVYGYSVYRRIGTGKVDVLENTSRAFLSLAMRTVAVYAFVVEYDDFARLYVSYELSAYRFQSATLGSYYVSVCLRYAVTKRSEPLGISRRNEFCGRHKHERISSFDLVEDLAERLLCIGSGQSFFGDEISYYLRIASGMEDSSRHLEFLSQIVSVAEIAVVSDSYSALAVIYLDRLTVVAVGGAGGAVTHVSYRYLALRKFAYNFFGEYFVDESQILMRTEKSVVVDDYAATLLTSVLKGVKSVIYGFSHVAGSGRKYTENSAFFIDFALHKLPPLDRILIPTLP